MREAQFLSTCSSAEGTTVEHVSRQKSYLFSDYLGTLEKDLTLPAGLCLFHRSKVWGKHFWWRALFVRSSEWCHPPAAEGVQADHSQVHEEGLLWCLPAAVCAEHPTILPELFCIFSVQGSFERQLMSTLSPSWACKSFLRDVPLCPEGWSPGVCVCIASSELGTDSWVNRKLVFIMQKH